MSATLETQSHIVVADRRPHDYRDLASLASQHGWHVHLLTSGRATLRLARSMPADLWMLNLCLPDMSGFDLFAMLCDRFSTARVFIVEDEYDADHERRACGCGAALYLCKDPRGAIDCSRLLGFIGPRPPPALADPQASIVSPHVQVFQNAVGANLARADVPSGKSVS